MDALIVKLEHLSGIKSNNDTLSTLLHLLNTVRKDAVSRSTWESICLNARILKEQHVLQDEEVKVLETAASQQREGMDGQPPTRDISIVVPPHPRDPLMRFPTDGVALPVELLETLNHTYFLHMLATDPSSVLPPGKSLLSTMIDAGAQRNHDESAPTLKERVEDIAHKAFWSEALETLSDPLPASQLKRLKGLHHDLRDALHPLLPSDHPVLLTLTLPLSPTNAPLRSAILHLRETTAILRERCAPARDALLDSVLEHIEDPPEHAPPSELAEVVVRGVRELLEAAELMKQDLRGFVLGQTSEAELAEAVKADARARERAVVFDLWGRDVVRERWMAWVDELVTQTDNVPRRRWVARLFQALGLESAVGCLLPTQVSGPPGTTTIAAETQASPSRSPSNTLPPPLLFTTTSLLHLQNLLQALTIAAALHSLTRLSAPSSTSPAPDFMQRIWTLLCAEAASDEGTKLVNLADEVVRARRTALTADGSTDMPTERRRLTEEEEQSLRAAVDRTLKPADPVFLLLHKRLLAALHNALVAPTRSVKSVAVPDSMRTGRDRPGKRPRLDLSQERGTGTVVAERMVVKGFEDEVLVRGVGELLGKIRAVVEWMEGTWADIVDICEAKG